jgi:hypothetical protein
MRNLIGWLELTTGDSAWRAEVGSRDPLHPGVVLTGEHLRLGSAVGVESRVEHLTITAVGAQGFWGWWKAEPGLELQRDTRAGEALPDPAGYFCALRERP